MNTNRPIDLNALHDMVLAQQSGAPISPGLQKPLTVDRDANLIIGDDKNPVNPASRVQTDIFHVSGKNLQRTIVSGFQQVNGIHQHRNGRGNTAATNITHVANISVRNVEILINKEPRRNP
ncbi:MAG: hypothetical protein WCP55_02955 [Lentisphaerota bacterium]